MDLEMSAPGQPQKSGRPDGQSIEADIVRLHAQVSFVPISEGGRAILRRDGLEHRRFGVIAS